jgi:hypothetical protein
MQRSVKTGIPGVPLLRDKRKHDIENKMRTLGLSKKHFVSFVVTFSGFLSLEKASFSRASSQQTLYQFLRKCGNDATLTKMEGPLAARSANL